MPIATLPPTTGSLDNLLGLGVGYVRARGDDTFEVHFSIPAVHGGTGVESYTAGDTLYAPSTNVLTTLPGNATSTVLFYSQVGDGTTPGAPVWVSLNSADVGLGSVENIALSTWGGSTLITSVGDVVIGTWQADAIADAYIVSAGNWNTAYDIVAAGAAGWDATSAEVAANQDFWNAKLDPDLDDGKVWVGSASNIAQEVALTDSASVAIDYDVAAKTLGAHVIQSGIDHGSIGGLTDDDHPQYHNDARALTWLGTRSTTDLAEGANLYYTSARFNTAFGAKTTGDLAEGSNLYFTTERAQDSVAGALTDSATIAWTYKDSANTISAAVINGVFTTGSYADPLWLTSLAKSKVGLSNVENTALSTWAGTTNLITLGTVTTGLWHGSLIGVGYTEAQIKTVTGTANRISIAGTGTDPTFDISATYVGQTSITTVGTIATGIWHGTPLAASYVPALNAIAAPTGDVSANGYKITSLADPVSDQDAVNLRTLLAYFAEAPSKTECAYCSTAALPANTYNNGSSGVGATLTGNANGPLALDSITLALAAVGSRILVAGEADTTHNGWFALTQLGVVALSPYILTRVTDADQGVEIGPGIVTPVVAPVGLTPGVGNDKKVFMSVCATPFIVGTTGISFSMVGAVYAAGAFLTLTGTTFSANVGTSSSTLCVGSDSRLSDARTPVGTALASADIWVGSAGNVAAQVAVSGDATLTNAGVVGVAKLGTPGTSVTINSNSPVGDGYELTASSATNATWELRSSGAMNQIPATATVWLRGWENLIMSWGGLSVDGILRIHGKVTSLYPGSWLTGFLKQSPSSFPTPAVNEMSFGFDTNGIFSYKNESNVSGNYIDYLMSFSSVLTLGGGAGAVGSSTKPVREDAVLAHGSQTTDSHHALAVAASSHGFEDKADKTKLSRLNTKPTANQAATAQANNVDSATPTVSVTTTIPANSLIVGHTYRLVMYGNYTIGSVNNVFRLSWLINGTAVAGITANTVSAGRFYYSFMFTVYSIGVSGSLKLQGFRRNKTSAEVPSGLSSSTVDTTANITLAGAVAFTTTTDVGNTCQIEECYFEEVL